MNFVKLRARHCRAILNMQNNVTTSSNQYCARLYSGNAQMQPKQAKTTPQFSDFKWINNTFDDLKMSPTLGLNEMQNLLKSENRNIYKFGFGQSPMPVPKGMVERLKENAHEKSYLPVCGLPELRESISAHFNNSHPNVNTSADDVLITPGTKQALFLLKLCLPANTEVLIPSPSWVSYAPQAQLLGRSHKWLYTEGPPSMDDWKITPSQIEEACATDVDRPRLLILNTPSNPTGQRYSNAELSSLADVCRKYGIVVLSDEIYGDLYHDYYKPKKEGYVSMASHYPERTIILNGISKTFGGGGWRLGFAVFPKSMRNMVNAFAVAASETFTSVSSPVQYASCFAYDNYDGAEIQNYLQISRKVFNGLAAKAYDCLSSIDGCEVVKPEGGFYVFPNFSNVRNIEKMQEKWAKSVTGNVNVNGRRKEWTVNEFSLFLMKECGVAGLPGCSFGRNVDELSMRLAYVDFNGEDIMIDKNHISEIPDDPEGMDLFLRQYCGKTVDGFEILKDYLSSL